MAKIRFKTNVPRHTRELSKADFTSLGVEDQSKLTFSGGEPTEVSDAVATALVEKLGDEFEIVEDDAEATVSQDVSGDATDEGNTSTPGGGTRDGAGARAARTR